MVNNEKPDISEAVALQASEWLVELQSGDNPQQIRLQVEQWRQKNPEHERAWQYIEQLSGHFTSLSSAAGKPLAYTTLLRTPQANRRDAIKLLSLMLFAGGSAWLARDSHWLASQRTAVGEQRWLHLAGHSVLLNTQTAINLDQPGRLTLLEGEVLIEAGQKQTLTVLADGIRCAFSGKGSRFSVYRHSYGCRLSVLEGEVGIYRSPSQAAVPISTLITTAEPGEQIEVTDRGDIQRNHLNSNALAWQHGMLIAHSMRLDDFLAEVSRYRQGKLRCAEVIAGLKVSGSYPLADTDRILAALEASLPIKMRYLTPYFVTAQPV